MSQDIVAYEYEVKAPDSEEWTKHYLPADSPKQPEDVWTDDYEIRDCKPLKYAGDKHDSNE
jgi:hypothetical protein